jgi:polysaccharide export outer membrane protein
MNTLAPHTSLAPQTPATWQAAQAAQPASAPQDLDSLIYAQAAYAQAPYAQTPYPQTNYAQAPYAQAQQVPQPAPASGPSGFLAKVFSRARPNTTSVAPPAADASTAPTADPYASPAPAAAPGAAYATATPAPAQSVPAARPSGFFGAVGGFLARGTRPGAPAMAGVPAPAPGTAMAGVPAPVVATEQPYTLDSGDRLRIMVFGQEGLTNSYTVDASGNVTMPLIGTVAARGCSTEELSRIIAERLRRGFIREPHVAIEIEAYRPFFILGEVTYPGQYPYVPNMTIETAVAIAGGFSPRAYRWDVFLDRPAPGGLVRSRSSVPLLTQVRPGDTIVIKERWF